MSELYDVNPELNPDQKARIEAELGISNKKIHAKFVLTAPLHPMLSAETGRPIHTDVVSIVEIHEGIRDYISRPATEEDKAKYPVQWAGFQRALANPQYPIDHLAGAKPSEVAMFKSRGILTIQAAAAIESPPPEIAGAVLRAKRWMAICNGEKPRIKLEAVA
jgi:hypothetical protein